MSQRAADRNRQTSAHDPVRAEHSDRHVGDMHGAATTPAIALAPAHDFQKESRYIKALGQGMAVPALVGRERIVRLQCGRDPCRNRFLSDRKMDEAGNFSVTEQRRQTLFHFADQFHAGMKLQQLGRRRLCLGSSQSCLAWRNYGLDPPARARPRIMATPKGLSQLTAFGGCSKLAGNETPGSTRTYPKPLLVRDLCSFGGCNGRKPR